MARIFGKDFTRRELMQRVGDISQIAGAREYSLESGKARGVRAVDVKTGGGLSFTVLPDRGMDIAWADYKGMALSFISKTGVTSPSYFEPQGNGFLRGFHAGLLTTCGLTYMGAACEDEGKNLGLHGRASNTPAEDVCVTHDWIGDELTIKVSGRIRESMVFGENITLTREIVTRLGENRLVLRDIVENCGFERQPLMLLYHCNFGFPLLDKGARLILPEGSVSARDMQAERGIENYKEFEEPTYRFFEQVFYHDLNPQLDGRVCAYLLNESLGESGVAIYIKYHKSQLPYFVEWKQMGEGDYVLGLEPATWYPEGRSEARKRGELKFLEPGETKEFEIEIGVFNSTDLSPVCL